MNYEQKQSLLNYFRPITGIRCAPDGIWGPTSVEATRAFQQAYGLPADGIWGPQTEKKIREVIGKDLKPEVPKPRPSNPNKNPETWDDVKYFQKKEFACKCGGRYCDGYPVEPSLKLAHLLDQIREHFGQPVIITSGIRCNQHNVNVGGAPRSKHKEGIAADIQVRGIAPSLVANYAETLLPGTGGIGRYTTFTHIDVRPQKARWNG